MNLEQIADELLKHGNGLMEDDPPSNRFGMIGREADGSPIIVLNMIKETKFGQIVYEKAKQAFTGTPIRLQ